MPCPFTGPKMFCASPNFLSQPKNLTAFSASSKNFVPAQKLNLLVFLTLSNQSKSQILFHINSSPLDLYTITLVATVKKKVKLSKK